MAKSRTGAAAWLPWAALAVVVVVALGYGSGAGRNETMDDRVHSISLTIKCPQCSGQSVATSEATTAVAIRNDIEARLRRGQTADQIRDYYANSYGESFLLNPSNAGASRLVWALPVLAMVAAFAGLALAFRHWRVAGEAEVTAADRDLVRAAQAGHFPAAEGDAGDGPDEPDEHGEGDGR